MANWASTSYVIEGSKEDVSKVYQIIDDFINGRKKPVAETASDGWEGNIVKTLGATAERCRQPLATLRERLHLSARATLLLHFVLELAISFLFPDFVIASPKNPHQIV